MMHVTHPIVASRIGATADRRRRRGIRALIAAMVGVLAALLVSAGTASAHAELVTTDPAGGAILATGPSSITLTFSEPVEISLGGVRLFDGAGDAVDVGASRHGDGGSSTVVVDLPALSDGSYVVDWQVVSADSHPVQGAFTFQVGTVSNLAPGLLDDIIGRDHTSRPAGIALSVSRGLVTAAMAIVFGGLAAIALSIVPAARRVRFTIIGGAVMGLVAGLLALPLEVGYATGRSLSVVTDGEAWSAAFDSRLGVAWVVRALVVGVLGVGLAFTHALRRQTWWQLLVILGTIAIGITSAFGGHGATGRWQLVGIVATVFHVGGMAVWLGGLVAVVSCVGHLDLVAVRRFSMLGLTMIGAVVVSGAIQSLRQLGSWSAFTETSYGVLLIWKLVAVAVLLYVAAVSRHLVHGRILPKWAGAPQRRTLAVGAGVLDESDIASDDPVVEADTVGFDRQRLRRAVIVEAVLAVAIIVATSLLMAANPSQALNAQPYSKTLVQGDYLGTITVSPGRVGANELHIYISNAQSSLSVPDSLTVSISDPSREVDPIDIPVERAGAGHFTTNVATFPFGATWTLTVEARYGDFDTVTFTADVPVR